MDCARSIAAGEVVRGRPRRFAPRGAPGEVTSDQGPEGVAHQVTSWRRAHQVDTPCIDPGRPWQHGHHESVTGGFGDGGLDRWRLASVQEARRLRLHWREEDTDERPHGALTGLPPAAVAAQSRASRENAACAPLTWKRVA